MEPLLLSTMGKLIYWDGEKANTVYKTQGRIYGITWNQEHLFIIAGRKNENILVFDKQLKMQNTIQCTDGMRDAHQALWLKGTLYIMDTGRESIIYHAEKTNRIRWPGRFCEKHEKPHINSIWYNKQQFYIVEHWRKRLPKKIRILDLNWQTVNVLTLGRNVFKSEEALGIHNVYVENDYLYTLGPEVIIKISLQDGSIYTQQVKSPWPCYVRGLARTDNEFYLGLSKFHYIRDKRIKGDSAFMVLDNNLQIKETIILKDAGQVYEIRALKGDRAHNGIDCPFQG